MSKRCGGDSEGMSEKAEADLTRGFVAGLPICANIH